MHSCLTKVEHGVFTRAGYHLFYGLTVFLSKSQVLNTEKALFMGRFYLLLQCYV